MARYDVTLPDNPPGCLTPNSLEKASRQVRQQDSLKALHVT